MPLAAEQIYRGTDDSGKPLFTDQPQPGARPVELPPVNTVEPVEPNGTPATGRQQAADQGYRRVSLGVPRIIPNGLAGHTVTISTEPALRAGHRWRLLLDGALVATGQGEAHTFEQLARGPHTLEVEIVDARGAVLGSSGGQKVFVYWPGQGA